MFETFLFVAVPYAAVAFAIVGGIVRYRSDRWTYSSQSSQLLEGRTLFWGSNAWHYGIVIVLFAHVAALAVSDAWASLVANPARLYTLEAIGITCGFLAFGGLAVLTLRRLPLARIRAVTTPADWALLLLLLAQVALGLAIAVLYRWGSEWYGHSVVPWLESLVEFQPKTQTFIVLPWVVKLHALGGFLLIGLFPFTRLVHVVSLPLRYLIRPYEVVIWNRRRRPQAGQTGTA